MPEHQDNSRHFPNWIKAYEEYMSDGFVPSIFDKWSAISLISAVLERKVYLPWTPTFSYRPNLYVLLVALPGIGKSTAINRAFGIFQELRKEFNLDIKVMPTQITEAMLIEHLSNSKTSYMDGSMVNFQSANFYVASEASNSFKNLYGDMLACFTDFYDCPDYWEKATKGAGYTKIINASLCMLAGTTFDYLGQIIHNGNIQGGLASRITYVMTKEVPERKLVFQPGATEVSNTKVEHRRKLIQDLHSIYQMVGPMYGTPEAGKAWEKWYGEFEAKRLSLKSEKMQSLLVRTNTLVMKLTMILAAAESNSNKFHAHHMEQAIGLAADVEKELPDVFREAKAGDVRSQEGLNQALLRTLQMNKGTMEQTMLSTELLMKGFEPARVASIMDAAIKGDLVDRYKSGDQVLIKLRVNPNEYL